ncbi:MAG: hypothetical protein H6837_05880 [Planctomycetes bacterium]|nr:hypothetical protein [Planctomycetota bacterium]
MPRIDIALFCLLASPVIAPAQGALLAELEPGATGSFASRFTSIGSTTVFVGQNRAMGRDLWRTDGSASGTQPIDLFPGAGSAVDTTNLERVGDRALFVGTDGQQWGLWSTDGTRAGSRLLYPLVPGTATPWHSEVSGDGSVAYLMVRSSATADLLLRSDGTSAGTSVVRTIPGSGAGQRLILARGLAYFGVLTTSGTEVWVTDGTAIGTVRLAAFATGWNQTTPVGGRVYFVQGINPTFASLWVTDGTLVGTRTTGVLTNRHVLSIAPRGNDLLVLASPIGGAVELWRVDQNLTATLLATLIPGSASQIPAYSAGYLIAADDQVFVVLGGFNQWKTMWRSNGTAMGTVQFLSPANGVDAWGPYFSVGNSIVFPARDVQNDREPWISDGTTAGTRKLIDVNQGSGSSNPLEFALSADLPRGARMFFVAGDAQFGTEPRVLPLSVLGAAAVVSVSTPCSGGRRIPQLDRVGGQPSIGNAGFGLRLDTGRPNTLSGLLVDLVQGAPIGACPTLLPAVLELFQQTDTVGRATWATPVPNDAALVGLRVYVQGLVQQPGGAVLGVADSSSVSAVLIGR